MPSYLIYRADSGEITKTLISGVPLTDADIGPGLLLIEGEADDAARYIDVLTGAVIARPHLDHALDKAVLAADGGDEARLSGLLPAPCKVRIEGPIVQQLTVTDGELIFTATDPGRYRITMLPPFPYMPASVTIDAG